MAEILIVEDDQPFADVLAFTLRLEGHRVLIACTAEDGIKLGLAHHPDVVIADWMLRHRLHGGNVCGRIRAACPDVKTIIMTGYADVAPHADPETGRLETIVEKPFRKQRILDVVNQALSRTTELTTSTAAEEWPRV